MRNAALTLGVIGGIIAMFVGFFAYGYVELSGHLGEVAGPVENPGLWQATAVLAPILAIAGGAMARARALWGGIAMLLAAAAMLQVFGFTVATMFPIALCGAGGLLAIAAGRPDRDVAHF